MNAIEFVKKHGIKETIKVVELHPVSTLINIGGSCVSVLDLKQIVEAFEKVSLAGGLNEAKRAIAGNYLNASYYMAGGTYLRYGAIGVRIVRDGEYKDYWGGIDSSRLVHLDYLPKSINLVEQCNA